MLWTCRCGPSVGSRICARPVRARSESARYPSPGVNARSDGARPLGRPRGRRRCQEPSSAK